MGCLRFLLAVFVVFYHAGPFRGFRSMGGCTAVQTFFMISGFYMTMILRTKYVGAGANLRFFANRFLRLYPAYWTMLFLSWASLTTVYTLTGQSLGWHKAFQTQLQPLSSLYFYLTNLIIFGQDGVLLLSLDSVGNLHFTENWDAHGPVFQFLLVPPTWSLGVELTFYLIAPFLVRRRLGVIATLLLASLALRGFIYFGLGLYCDPWLYRCFPLELALFLMGTLSFHLYEATRPSVRLKKWFPATGILFVGITLGYEYIPDFQLNTPVFWKTWCYYAVAVLAIPALFEFSKTSKLDRYIGEFSYPIYISHIPVVTLLAAWLPTIGKMKWLSGLSLLFSLALAVLLIHFVMNPIERIRQRRAERQIGASSDQPLPRAA